MIVRGFLALIQLTLQADFMFQHREEVKYARIYSEENNKASYRRNERWEANLTQISTQRLRGEEAFAVVNLVRFEKIIIMALW